MKNIYITIAGTKFQCGAFWMKEGLKVKLIKEPDNDFDKEAIRVEAEGIGKIGYVANSVKTVVGNCMSAGRLYDRIGDEAEAKVKFILSDSRVICKVRKRSIIYDPDICVEEYNE
jgi:CRISPR/Cas system-associated endonuclease/helicase Cas3